MKKIMLLAVVLLSLPLVFADTQIKFFSWKINQTECIEKISLINSSYLDGVRVIRIYDIWLPYGKGQVINGRYFSSGVIDIYDNCNMNTIVHELAHHNQESGDWLLSHDEEFYRIEAEIWKGLTEGKEDETERDK